MATTNATGNPPTVTSESLPYLYPGYPAPCPYCRRCPCCGRALDAAPYQPVQPWPIYPWPNWQPWITWTYSSGSTATATNLDSHYYQEMTL